MQVTINQVIDVITVRNRFVTATGTVNVTGIVAGTLVGGSASVRIRVGHFQHVLFDLSVFADMVQMTIVQIVDVVAVLDAGVFAIGAVLVIVMSV